MNLFNKISSAIAKSKARNELFDILEKKDRQAEYFAKERKRKTGKNHFFLSA